MEPEAIVIREASANAVAEVVEASTSFIPVCDTVNDVAPARLIPRLIAAIALLPILNIWTSHPVEDESMSILVKLFGVLNFKVPFLRSQRTHINFKVHLLNFNLTYISPKHDIEFKLLQFLFTKKRQHFACRPVKHEPRMITLDAAQIHLCTQLDDAPANLLDGKDKITLYACDFTFWSESKWLPNALIQWFGVSKELLIVEHRNKVYAITVVEGLKEEKDRPDFRYTLACVVLLRNVHRILTEPVNEAF